MALVDDYEVSASTTTDEIRAHRAATTTTLTRLRNEVAELKSRAHTEGVATRITNLETAIRSNQEFEDVLRNEYARRIGGQIASGQMRSEAAATRGDLQVMRRVDPWNQGAELRDRAMAAVDHATRDGADNLDGDKLQRMIDSPESHVSDEVQKYIIATGSPAYRAAFNEWLRNPTRPMWTSEETYAMRTADSLRAAMSLTTANGGALVPYVLDPTINLTNNGTANPFRAVANVVTIAGATEWRGVTSAGVTAEWLAEAAEAADASPTFAQPAIPTHKGMAYLFGSYEVLSDSNFANQLAALLADAKDRLEGTSFATGNGTTAPRGLITGLVAGSSIVTSTTTDTFALADVYKVQEAVPARFRRPGANTWLANIAIANKMRQFDTAGGAALWAQLDAGTPPTLLGDRFNEASDMDGTITALADNYILVNGDIRSAYTIVDRVGMEIVYDSMVLGANRRPTGEAGFVGYFRTGAEVTNAAAARVLNCT